MTVLQLNPPGMATTDDGYISSITVRYNGADNVLTPDVTAYVPPTAVTRGQITLPNATTGAIAAANRLIGGAGNHRGPGGQGISLVHTAS